MTVRFRLGGVGLVASKGGFKTHTYIPRIYALGEDALKTCGGDVGHNFVLGSSLCMLSGCPRTIPKSLIGSSIIGG